MEIERKYLIHKLPENLDTYPYKKIEQAYLCTEPVVRIRKQDEEYFLTYKGKGLLVREEYNLPLTEIAYLHLKEKADGIVLSKTRYLLPLKYSPKVQSSFSRRLNCLSTFPVPDNVLQWSQ